MFPGKTSSASPGALVGVTTATVGIACASVHRAIS